MIFDNSKEKNNRRFNLELKHIKFIAIGFEPLCIRLIHKVVNAMSGIRKLLPNSIASKKFVHASAFLGTEYYHFTPQGSDIYENYKGVLVEFGKYDKDREGDYQSEVFYIGKDGARFTRYDYLSYIDRIIKNNTFLGSQLNNCPLIVCKISNHHNLLTLFSHIFFNLQKGEISEHIDNKTKVEHPWFWMMDLCKEKIGQKYDQQWEKVNYSLLFNNCQTFISKIIESLNAIPMDPKIVETYRIDMPNEIYQTFKKIIDESQKKLIFINYIKKFLVPSLGLAGMDPKFLRFVSMFIDEGYYKDNMKENKDLLGKYHEKNNKVKDNVAKLINMKNCPNIYLIKKDLRPVLLIKEQIPEFDEILEGWKFVLDYMESKKEK